MSLEFRIESNLNEVVDNMEQKKEQILEAWGLFLESEAKVRTPVDEGDLRTSIHHKVRLNDDAVDIIAGGDGLQKDVDYAAYVEFGTSKMKPQPFMQPAIQDNTNKLKRIAEDIWEG